MNNRSLRARRGLPLAVLLSLLAGPAFSQTADVTPADTEAVRELFLQQAAAETAHDIDALNGMFAPAAPGQPDPVSFVARAYRFWGKDAVMQHFKQTFAGTWSLEPDPSALRVIALNRDTVQVYAPTKVTIGVPGQPAKTATFLINEFMIRSPSGWKVATVIPVPAQ
ncbi:nuclear transport factor 2 family protein [Paraburkholderia sp. SARCC-3016]|uniref:YybH family protein n=1 Tax=Paraburkholderia sp. SARCC-3016 TaxID=3058611 RepID=UPI002809FCAF|nr:nuclear transport factor 2 family protein [Paraburkholderia sp. SARCC-3016]MDQ7976688.1 nuclear transport factor 2 family protein [Paraburkholderia sp. SARCC-3016]